MATKNSTPTIRGIFVKSHIKALRDAKGDQGVRLLERKFGRKLHFTSNQNIRIRDEVRILELCVDIVSKKKLTKKKRAFEAGRLHFRNFSTTPLARILLSTFKNKFKRLMMGAEYIAGHVFQSVHFKSEDVGKNMVRITMENNDYPLEHFQGLFYEWMYFSGLKGTVSAKVKKTGEYIYTMDWKSRHKK